MGSSQPHFYLCFEFYESFERTALAMVGCGAVHSTSRDEDRRWVSTYARYAKISTQSRHQWMSSKATVRMLRRAGVARPAATSSWDWLTSKGSFDGRPTPSATAHRRRRRTSWDQQSSLAGWTRGL